MGFYPLESRGSFRTRDAIHDLAPRTCFYPLESRGSFRTSLMVLAAKAARKVSIRLSRGGRFVHPPAEDAARWLPRFYPLESRGSFRT